MDLKEKNFFQLEDDHQKQFDDFKLPPFDPQAIIQVKLMHIVNTQQYSIGKETTFKFLVSFQSQKVNGGEEHLKSFEITRTFNRAVNGNQNIDEAVCFVGTEESKITIRAVEGAKRNYKLDLSVSDPQKLQLTKNWTLTVQVTKDRRERPDFRYSMGLCQGEKDFRKRRLPFVCKAMKKQLNDQGPSNEMETPVVSLVGSGGGYRAVIGMCGAMEALAEEGLLDVITYACGLSGSAWYLTSAYARKSLKGDKQTEFHEDLRKQMNRGMYKKIINKKKFFQYRKFVNEKCKPYNLPHTFANFFPGMLVGERLFKEQMSYTLSDLINYVKDGEVPYPIFAALNVKRPKLAREFHAWVERTPYEVCVPSYGVAVKSRDEGSKWNAGVAVRKCPELPLHYNVAMTGCAFAIFPIPYFSSGDEAGTKFVECLDKEGAKEKNNDGEKATETDGDTEEPLPTEPGTSQQKGFKRKTLKRKFKDTGFFEIPRKKARSSFQKVVRKVKNIIRRMDSRDFLLDRTALTNNFFLGVKNLKRHCLNPHHSKDPPHKLNQSNLNVSSGTEFLPMVDAGLLHNVATNLVLRPQRNTNLMIVMDFTKYESDHKFDYKPLRMAKKLSGEVGLEFPEIKDQDIKSRKAKDFILLPSDKPNCPTVLWFTLSNKAFKEKKIREANGKKNMSKAKKFRVFGKGSEYGTLNFKYSAGEFEWLRELMYFNVKNHIKEIKEQLIEAVAKKRRILQWEAATADDDSLAP